MSWLNLKAVLLENTDEGPFLPDVFWVLVGEDTGCVIPQGAARENELINYLQKLPGFDNKAMILSATCTDNKTFLGWKKDQS